MTRTLITGATGFLGSHLAQRLAPPASGEVVALVRQQSRRLERLGVDQVVGDIEDPASLVAALAGVKRVYHLAGMVSRDPRDTTRMMRVHVDGTRALLHACAAAGVERVVIASSSGTIAVSEEEKVHDETAPFALEVVKGWPYYLSKIYQEELALEAAARGGPAVVILNPSLLLGPGDARGSSTEDVLRFLQHKIPAIPKGGVNFCDVRDVAETFLVAMEKGRAGERYLLGGPNWTMETFFGRLERLSKVRGPRLTMPARWQRTAAKLLQGVADWRGVAPAVDRVSVEMGQCFWWCDSSKARRELGWDPRDPQETLLDTIRDVKKHFLGEEPRIEIGGAD